MARLDTPKSVPQSPKSDSSKTASSKDQNPSSQEDSFGQGADNNIGLNNLDKQDKSKAQPGAPAQIGHKFGENIKPVGETPSIPPSNAASKTQKRER